MIFELYWADYDAYTPYLFEGAHHSARRWQRDCYKALRAVGAKFIRTRWGWVGANDWVEAAGTHLEKIGYKRVRPIAWGFSGGSILENKDHEDYHWKRIVGAELYAKAIAKNKKRREKHNRRLEQFRRKQEKENLKK